MKPHSQLSTRSPCTGAALTLALSFVALAQALAADSPEGIEFFEKRIRPVLVDKCYKCHSADAEKLKGGLLLDTREGSRQGGDTGPAVVLGNENSSLLLSAIRYEEDLEMPPKERLPAEVVADFAKWISMGAPDPRDGALAAKKNGVDLEEGRNFWSFQPIRQPAAPQPKNAAWPRSDIDRFVLAALENKGLSPVADAGPHELIRRISFDLSGLPPTPEEVTEYTQSAARDPQAAVAKLVDRLLQSPRFGERWGRHWLDVARYAESSGSGHNVLFPLAFRYRDYVIDAFHRDKPYDQFIREQIAGDLLPAHTDAQRNEQLIATGFLAVGVKDLRERETKRFRMAIAEEQIDATSRAMLGLTVACARCHDHKFDPIPTRDYYALAGIFTSSEPLLGARRNRITEPFASGVQPLAGKPVAFTDSDQKDLLSERLKLTSLRLKLRDEKRRVLMDKDLLKAREKEQEMVLKGEPTVRELEASGAAQEARCNDLNARYNAALAASAMAMREAKPADCAIHIRGEDSQLGEVVPRGFLAVLTDEHTPQVNPARSGRLELAHWIASPTNPLTARVMANRIWQHLFGVGLVETPD
nr:PSD1 and planctomycete cytochrome C domain-containing protein [Verrucomicrobiota bacterium]